MKQCVAFGSFEFVHRGHLKVAKRVVELAKEKRLDSKIVSCPAIGEVYTTEKEKEYLFKKQGIDMFETVSVSRTEWLKKHGQEIEVLVVGANCTGLQEIQELSCRMGFQLDVLDTVKYDGKPITRELLHRVFEENDFELLTELCGHPYILIGDVVHGKKLGRTVGMPTINLHIYKKKKRPNCGVYATKVTLGQETYKSATNIGKRPTVDDFDYVTIETFILDFDKEIYGEICILEIHKFLREVKKFDSLEAVQEQVKVDVSKVYQMFA